MKKLLTTVGIILCATASVSAQSNQAKPTEALTPKPVTKEAVATEKKDADTKLAKIEKEPAQEVIAYKVATIEPTAVEATPAKTIAVEKPVTNAAPAKVAPTTKPAALAKPVKDKN